MIHKCIFSLLLIVLTVSPCQLYLRARTNQEEIKAKQEQELKERAQFHENVQAILKAHLPGVKANYRGIKNVYEINDNKPATSYVILLPKNTQISKEQKNLALHYLHSLKVAGFHFEK